MFLVHLVYHSVQYPELRDASGRAMTRMLCTLFAEKIIPVFCV